MEKRLILAIVLSFLILVLWQLVFVKKQPQQPAEELQAEIQKEPEVESAEQNPSEIRSITGRQALPEKEAAEPKAPSRQITEEEEQQIVLDTSLYQAVWSNRGAVLKSWKLKKHKDENKEDFLELISGRAAELNTYPFSLFTDRS